MRGLPKALLALAACLALAAQAQRPEPVRRVGILGIDSTMQARRADAFRDEMRRLGEYRCSHIRRRESR